MAVKYYVNAEGKFLYTLPDDVDPEGGAIEVPVGPTNARDTWDGESWIVAEAADEVVEVTGEMARHFAGPDGRFLGTVVGGPPPSPDAIEVGVAPANGLDIWNGIAWAPTAARVAADTVTAAKSARDQYLQSVTCPLAGGRPIQLDATAQGNLAAASLQANVVKLSDGAVAWPQRMITKGWRLADNSWLPLPRPDDMISLGLWAAAEVERVRDLAWDQIDAARATALPASPAVDSHK